MIWRILMSIIAFILTSWLFSIVYTPHVVNVAAEAMLDQNEINSIEYSETLSANGNASSENLLSGVLVFNYNKETDYWELIKQAVEDGSPYALKMAEIYEAQRNLKIDMEGISLPKTNIFETTNSLDEIRRSVQLYDRKSPYKLTLKERQLVERCVMAEAGNESYKGQMAVAQAILDGTLRSGLDVASSIRQYRIVSRSDIPVSNSVKEAVSAVFDYGERVTTEKMDLWYAPKRVYSRWHESQNYVTTIGNHKFFWMNE
jgi:spore germination cell wall hydrolase CwlJ-like protein